MSTTRIKIGGFAGCEMDWLHDSLEAGDSTYTLGANWDGTALHIYDAEHADRAWSAMVDLANDWDADIEAGTYDDHDSKKIARAVRDGFYRAAARILEIIR